MISYLGNLVPVDSHLAERRSAAKCAEQANIFLLTLLNNSPPVTEPLYAAVSAPVTGLDMPSYWNATYRYRKLGPRLRSAAGLLPRVKIEPDRVLPVRCPACNLVTPDWYLSTGSDRSAPASRAALTRKSPVRFERLSRS